MVSKLTSSIFHQIMEDLYASLEQHGRQAVCLLDYQQQFASFMYWEILCGLSCSTFHILKLCQSYSIIPNYGLRAENEATYTRLILHCIHVHMDTVFVSAWGTDVLLLLLAHFDKMTCGLDDLTVFDSAMPPDIKIVVYLLDYV